MRKRFPTSFDVCHGFRDLATMSQHRKRGREMRKSSKWCLCVALVLTGCRAPTAADDPPILYDIRGVVTDSGSGRPLRGATVNLKIPDWFPVPSATAVTDSTGAYTISYHSDQASCPLASLSTDVPGYEQRAYSTLLGTRTVACSDSMQRFDFALVAL